MSAILTKYLELEQLPPDPSIREAMGLLWYALSEAEQQQLLARSRIRASPQAGGLTDLPDNVQKLIKAVADPFFAEGAAQIHVAYCCQRVFISRSLPDCCGSCKQTPQLVTLTRKQLCS